MISFLSLSHLSVPPSPTLYYQVGTIMVTSVYDPYTWRLAGIPCMPHIIHLILSCSFMAFQRELRAHYMGNISVPSAVFCRDSILQPVPPSLKKTSDLIDYLCLTRYSYNVCGELRKQCIVISSTPSSCSEDG